MEVTMSMMRNAFSTGTMDAVRALMIWRRAFSRPKRRSTRKARMTRRMETPGI